MPSFNKNFVVKHGLEVNTNLLFANADNDRIGIGTTNPLNTLDVRGGIAATDVVVSGITTTANLVVNGGFLRAAGSSGIVGQYLRSTGTGVEWASFPQLRTDDSFTAGIGQTLFPYAYTPGFLDVYVNGVKLNETDFNASNGTQVFLNAACFGGEVIQLVGYNPTAVGAGGTGILGITVRDEGSIIGNDNGVTSIDFVGTGINAVGTGAGVTITFAADPGWAKTSTNVYTSFNVGIGTTIPRHSLHVVGVGSTALFVDGNARVTGILSIGTSSITLDGNTNTINVGTGVTISSTTLTVPNLVVTNTSTIAGTAISVRDGVNNYSASVIDFGNNLTVDFSAGIATVNATGGGGGGISTDSYWIGSASGIHTTSRVGIGTTNPTSELHVIGDSRITGVITAAQFIRQGGSSSQFLKADGSSDPTTYLASNGDASTLINLTGVSSGTYGSSTLIPQIIVDSNGRITSISTVSVSGGGVNVSISDTAPSSPTQGNLWYSSLTGRGFIYYNDGDSSQWVDFSPAFGAGIAGTGITRGDLSVSTNAAGIASLSYDSSTGVFSFTPPNLTGYATTNSIVGFITSGALTGYATTNSIVGFITSGALTGYATEGYVGVATSGLLSSTGSAANLTSLTGATAGTYGSATAVPIITVNASGRITGITTTGVSGGGGTGITDGDKGDITVSGSGATWTIDNTSVTYAKIQNVTNNRILGRSTAGAGSAEEISIGTGLSLSGGSLSATGTSSQWVTVAAGIHTTSSVGIGTTNPQGNLQVAGSILVDQLRTKSIAERTTLVNGNTVGLVFSTGGGNVAICTNPTGDITLNVTNIPTDGSFDNHSMSFSVIVTQTGTARTCTAVTLNGVSRTIRWSGGSLTNALAGVSTSNGYDIFTFTGINTVGSASTTTNYVILGSVNGGFN